MTGTLWISGAGGFTGRAMVAHMRATAPAVRLIGIDRSPTPVAGLDILAPLDLVDTMSIARLANAEPPTWVVHLAGLMPPSSDADLWHANVGGTVGLLCGLREGGCRETKVVSVGSAAEYSPTAASPLEESARCGGASPYGNSKLAQSLTALAFGKACGFGIVVARPFNLVGPGLPTRLVAGSLVQQVRDASAATPIRVGNLKTARDFVDVRDAVDAYWRLALERDSGGIYNVCSDKPVTIDELLRTLQQVSQRAIQIEPDVSRMRPDDAVCVYGVSQRLRAATGWRPRFSLSDSLRDMLTA
jgi:GDP-4-dehydro-6-deoxy-D-mannose reductase